MQKLQLVVRLKGATDEELQRAGVAAMAVFGKYGITPLRAAEASFAREGWDLSGFDPGYEGYSEEDAAIANVWDEAAVAAAKAGCVDWPHGAQPDRATLEIVGFDDDDEEDDADDRAEMRRMFDIHVGVARRRKIEPSRT